jgi:hypothetical protein
MITVLRCCCSCADKFSLRKTPPDLAKSVRFRGENLYPLCRLLRSPRQLVAALIPHAGNGSFSPDYAAIYAGFLKAPGQETGFIPSCLQGAIFCSRRLYREKLQIPLNPPFPKGDFNTPPLKKGGRGDFSSSGAKHLWFMNV